MTQTIDAVVVHEYKALSLNISCDAMTARVALFWTPDSITPDPLYLSKARSEFERCQKYWVPPGQESSLWATIIYFKKEVVNRLNLRETTSANAQEEIERVQKIYMKEVEWRAEEERREEEKYRMSRRVIISGMEEGTGSRSWYTQDLARRDWERAMLREGGRYSYVEEGPYIRRPGLAGRLYTCRSADLSEGKTVLVG